MAKQSQQAVLLLLSIVSTYIWTISEVFLFSLTFQSTHDNIYIVIVTRNEAAHNAYAQCQIKLLG